VRPNIASKYSGGIGGGSVLKLAVKVPKFVTLRVDAVSVGLMLKRSKI
jgi:hypothetical protein